VTVSAGWLGLVFMALGCASTQDPPGARSPGDPCLESCPEGMICSGTTHMKFPKRTYPGHCDLLPGRCAVDKDCGRGQQCVRTTARIGLCAPSPRL
jgi:hypothetical protein